jgi:hypothetical protein
MVPEAFLDKEVRENRRLVAAARGLSFDAWSAELNATDRLLGEIEEAYGLGDTPAAIADAVGKTVDEVQPVIDVIARESLGEPRKPRKERDHEAELRAGALAMQLKITMRTAWKYYDEANADRIEAEDEIIRVMKRMRALGLGFDRIADEVGGTAESVEGMLRTYEHVV